MSDTVQPMWLAGERTLSGQTLDVHNKFTGDRIAVVARASANDVRAAIAAAERAFEQTRDMPAFTRQAILQQLVRHIEERREELCRTVCLDAGKPIKDARGEVTRTIDTFRVAAEEATRLRGEYDPLDISPRAEGCESITRRFPIGPCGFITPFNFPLNLAAHKVAPAIAVGCPFVLKPASATPLSALLLGEILSETEWPRAAFSVLPCASRDIEPLVTDDRIRKLSFTGSPAVGWALKAKAGRKKVTLELGGTAPCIVDRDADLDRAAERITFGAFYQSGQSCISVQRVLIQADVYDDLRDRLVAGAEALKAGDPMDEYTFIGPLITLDDARRVEEWVNAAVKAGARVLCGGRRDGAIHAPTLLENTPRDQNVSCAEVFGPVATLEPFLNFKEAIRVANDTEFGLQAGVFTNNLDHAWYAFRQLDYAGVVLNDVPAFRVDSMPYGGIKQSGFGREGIRFAMHDMTELKLLVLNNIGRI
ncbi:MAG: aldehyde dehydrogenase family protein [Phycisphaerales bacterium]|nr:aldehyde dehydrogenase family protein [Phycisphaerales bacterium]